MVYWIDAGYKTVEKCRLDGSEREQFSKVTEQDVGDPLCMTLDHESQVLYWASRQGDRVVIKKLQLGQVDPYSETLFALSAGINSIASFQVSAFVKYCFNLSMCPFCKRVSLI